MQYYGTICPLLPRTHPKAKLSGVCGGGADGLRHLSSNKPEGLEFCHQGLCAIHQIFQVCTLSGPDRELGVNVAELLHQVRQHVMHDRGRRQELHFLFRLRGAGSFCKTSDCNRPVPVANRHDAEVLLGIQSGENRGFE